MIASGDTASVIDGSSHWVADIDLNWTKRSLEIGTEVQVLIVVSELALVRAISPSRACRVVPGLGLCDDRPYGWVWSAAPDSASYLWVRSSMLKKVQRELGYR